MTDRVENWLDQYGKITFKYRGEIWSVVDKPGPGMIFQTNVILLDVPLGQYPSPGLAGQVLNDFFACNPEVVSGKWQWEDNLWTMKESVRR